MISYFFRKKRERERNIKNVIFWAQFNVESRIELIYELYDLFNKLRWFDTETKTFHA